MSGEGVIVKVGDKLEPFDVNTDGAKVEVRDTFNYVQSESETLKSRLDQIENAMLDLIKNFDIKDIDTALDKVDVDRVNFPSPRSFAELILNTAWPTDVPIKPILEDFGDFDFSFIEPAPPDAFEAYFNFKGIPYSSVIRPELIKSVLNDIREGGTGLTVQAHDAILNRERNARLRNQATALRDALHATGENGVRVFGGNGQANAVIAEIMKAQTHADQDALNLITEKDYEYTVRSKEFVHTLAVELEKLLFSEWDASENRRFEAGKAEFELAYSAVELNVEMYKQRWEGVRIRFETLKSKIEAIAEKNRSLTDRYEAEWEGYKSNVDAIAAENTAKVQIRGLEIDTYKAEIDAAATQQNANLAEAQFEFQQILAAVETELKVHGINTDGYKTEADLKNAVLGTLSKIIAQVVASTIGVMNASASMSFSGSESMSKSISSSATVSEGYSGEV